MDYGSSNHATDQVFTGFRILVCTVGIIGNIIVILTILIVKKLRKSTPTWYILQLAIADTAFLATIPFQLVEEVKDEWIFPTWTCKAKQAVLYINYYSSMTFLTLMAIDRYISICHYFSERLRKFVTRKAAYILSGIVWTVSISVCIPIILFSKVRGVKPNCRCLFYMELQPFMEQICVGAGFGDDVIDDGVTFLEFCLKVLIPMQTEEEWLCSETTEENSATNTTDEPISFQSCGSSLPDFSRVLFGFFYFNFIVMFLVPFLIIITCYALIIRYTIKTAARLESVTTRSTSRVDSERRLVTMCVALVFVFTVCWLPFHVVIISRMNGLHVNAQVCTVLISATSFLTYLNSAINPFVYFIIVRIKRQFRKLKRTQIVTSITSGGSLTSDQPMNVLRAARAAKSEENDRVREEVTVL